jgi:mannose-6-phosphate isomerase-like protein (cupin superfamily)
MQTSSGAHRAVVVSPRDVPERRLPGSHGTVRVTIDEHTGSRHVLQRVFRYGPGRTPDLKNGSSEDVMFVLEGIGTLHLGSASFELAPGIAAWAPPGVSYAIENPGPHDLVVVSVLAPPPGGRPPAAPEEPVAEEHTYSVAEEEEPLLPAGEDRSFRTLVSPRYGCRNVTQFVGYIDATSAPPHTHTYEEAILILDGEGAVHADGESTAVGAGTAILLPPGVEHRLENTGRETLRLLGVFSPAGSPAARLDAGD